MLSQCKVTGLLEGEGKGKGTTARCASGLWMMLFGVPTLRILSIL